MSKSGRGQKCECGHARIKHNPNAGKCFELECECKFFKAVKKRGKRLKDTTKKAKAKQE
jgi:hypothetical protein